MEIAVMNCFVVKSAARRLQPMCCLESYTALPSSTRSSGCISEQLFELKGPRSRLMNHSVQPLYDHYCLQARGQTSNVLICHLY